MTSGTMTTTTTYDRMTIRSLEPADRYLVIENDGEIEEGAMVLLGASTKADDPSAIGFFGSGNKYAIATLLRENVPFTIYSGTERVTITKKKVVVRDVPFEQIVVNRKRTSLTTRMGPDWQVWYALREFIANALDEGRCEISTGNEPEGRPNVTRIVVEITSEVRDFIENFDRYFSFRLRDKAPLSVVEGHIFPGDGTMNVFRRGISVAPERAQRALWWYDLPNLTINESRVYQYVFQIYETVPNMLAQLDRVEDVLRLFQVFRDDEDVIENNLSWRYIDQAVPFSQAWREAIGTRTVYPRGVAKFFGANEDRRAAVIVPDDLAPEIARAFPDVHIVGHTGKAYENVTDPAIAARVMTLHDELCGVGVIEPYLESVKLVRVPDPETVAWYDPAEHTVKFVAEWMAKYEDDDVKKTLIEEHAHSVGCSDGSRDFVDHLMTLILRLAEDRLALRRVEQALEGRTI
jgi:hypothetical protein